MNITVIGTGYVGLVTGACFSKMGNKVYCVDIDENKINGLKNNILPIFEPNLDTIVKTSQDRKDLIFTTSIKEALDDTDIVFIAVGTPMAEDGSANLDYIFSAAHDIATNLTHDSLIVIKSTVPVGTAYKVKEEIQNILEIKIKVLPLYRVVNEGSPRSLLVISFSVINYVVSMSCCRETPTHFFYTLQIPENKSFARYGMPERQAAGA